jgi:hypothetical protein
MDIEKVRLYATKMAERRRLDKEVNDLKAELAVLENELLEAYAEEGMQSARVETPYGNFNVGPRSQLWATAPDGFDEEGKDYAKGCAALRAVGWGDFVQERFNTMSLSGHVRELVKMGIATLEYTEDGRLYLKSITSEHDLSPLVDGLKITEKFSLSVTKAAKK